MFFKWLFNYRNRCGCERTNPLIHEIRKIGGMIMSVISEFAAKQNAHNDKIDVALEGLAQDVADLNAKIEALQNSAGQISPEDQALLDALETRGDAIEKKVVALNALTPPMPPAG